MLEVLSLDVFVKVIATIALVTTVTLVAERATPFVAAMVAALPISAGPAYLFIAMDHGSASLADSALTGVGVNAVMAVFLYMAVVCIPKFGIARGLAAAVLVWVVGALSVAQAAPSLLGAIVLSCITFPIFTRLVRGRTAQATPAWVRLRLSDIALRALAVGAVVLAVLVVGRTIGAAVAGLTALIPIVWISTAIVLYDRLGAEACVAVLASGMLGMIGFCLALVALHWVTLSSGMAVGLSLALLVSVGWNVCLALLHRRGLLARRVR